jgi:radical SAM protein with 4Fe4S-binding SPASM domain
VINESQIKSSWQNTEAMFCAAGKSSYWISWDGKMLPCALMNSPYSTPFDSGFNSAWQEIKSMIREINRPEECKTCEYLPFCKVCPAKLQAETGFFEKTSTHICKMAMMVKKRFFVKEGCKNDKREEVCKT